MFSQQLKEHTQPAHLELEKKIIARIRSMRSEDDYLNFLRLFYGYFNQIEQPISKKIDLNLLPDYSERRKSSYILTDIASLNGDTENIPQSDDIPNITNHSEAMGALYVIEGSTLGGMVIKKMIAERLGLDMEKSLNFFDGYGAETFRMWEIFKMALNNEAIAGESNQQDILRAANEAFVKFKLWIEKHE